MVGVVTVAQALAGRAALDTAQLSLRAATRFVRGAERLASAVDDDERDALRSRAEGQVIDLQRPDGSTVRVHVAGPEEGPAVVLAHGYGLGAASWNLVTRALLDQGHRVVAFDWRAHGGSTDGDGNVTTEELVGDLRAVLAELELDDVLLVAHSTGGYVALAALVGHPAVAERLRGMVLVATLAGALLDGAPAGRLQLLHSSPPARVLRNDTLRLLVAGFAQGAGISSAVSQELLEEFAQADHDVLATLLADLSGRSYYGDLHGIQVPTIVLCGDADRTTPMAHSEAIAQELPHARLLRVDGASHLLNWQHPGRIAHVVAEFDEVVTPRVAGTDRGSVLVVLNPASGDHDPDDTQHAVVHALGGHDAAVEVRMTEGAGDAHRWAEQAAADGEVELVLAVGGDGTVREVVAGVVAGGGGVTVGVVPTGTANLLARAVGIPVDDPAAAADVAAGPGRREIDLLHLVERDEYAMLMVDAGFDARLVRDADRGAKDVLGALAYVAAGLRNTVGLRSVDLELEVDGESRTVTGHSVLCLNIGRIGQSVVVDEDIQPDDGVLHLGIARRATPWHVLGTAAGMVLRGRDAHPYVEWVRCERVRVASNPQLQLQLDGDPAGDTPVTVEVLPAAVELAVPTGSW